MSISAKTMSNKRNNYGYGVMQFILDLIRLLNPRDSMSL